MYIQEPVIITYERPREKVLFNAARDANCFFHLYESLWMLAGRNDVQSLSYYNSNIARYSDDGKTFNGSYGNRWRAKFGVDQLSHIIKHLTSTPNSRRAVLQMWGTREDLAQIDTSKDVCCLGADTRFRSPEGDFNIKNLAERFQIDPEYRFPVYTVDPITGSQNLGWMCNAWKSGIKKVIKVSFDDGSHIRVTANHVMYKKVSLGRPAPGRKGKGFKIEECEAGDLTVGNRVLADLPKGAPSCVDRDGRKLFKLNLMGDTRKSNMGSEHREYWRFAVNSDIGIDHDVHHKNEDKSDNRLENLEEVEHGEHQRRHKLKDPSWGKYTANRGIDGKFNKVSNHKVLAVENDGVASVYDFTVPGRHNAVLDNGVVVHNCNLSACFAIRDERRPPKDICIGGDPTWNEPLGSRFLDLTVFNRSNDIIWGTLGANAVHFAFLIEYMAAHLGVEVGVYSQVSNNQHAYLANWKPEEWLDSYNLDKVTDIPKSKGNYGPDVKQVPLVRDPATFDRELPLFVERHSKDAFAADYEEPFLRDVAQPMCIAYHYYKQRDFDSALAAIKGVLADDWRLAGTEWLERRRVKAQAKHEAANKV